MARRPEPVGGAANGLVGGEGLVGEVITSGNKGRVDAVIDDKDLLGKQQQHDNHEIDYAAFHTETGYFTGPIFMRTWSELPVDWSWELLHALFCACAAYIQISFITGAPWEANIHLVVVITFLMSQRLFYAFWGGTTPHRHSSLMRPDDFGGQHRTGITIARDVARFFLLAITFLDVGYCTAAVVQQDLVAQGGEKPSSLYGYILATEYFLPPLLLSSVSVALLRQSSDLHYNDLTDEALDARVDATDNLFLTPLVQSLRRIVIYAAEAIWCLGVLPCRFARGPLANDVSVADPRVGLLDFLSVSASSVVPGGPGFTMHLAHLLGKWKMITEQSALIRVQAIGAAAAGSGSIVRDKGRYYEAQAPMNTIRPSRSGGLFQHICSGLYGNVLVTRQMIFTLHVLLAWVYFIVMAYGALFSRSWSSSISVCTQEESFLPKTITSMAVPHDLSDFTLHVGDEHTSEAWEPRDAGQRVLNNTACTTSRAAWIAPWLLLVLGHSVQVHHMSGVWSSASGTPASLRASQHGHLDRACHQRGWMPPLYHQLSSSSGSTAAPSTDLWLGDATSSEGEGHREYYPAWERPGELTDSMLRSITTSSTYRFFRWARSSSTAGIGSAIRAATAATSPPAAAGNGPLTVEDSLDTFLDFMASLTVYEAIPDRSLTACVTDDVPMGQACVLLLSGLTGEYEQRRDEATPPTAQPSSTMTGTQIGPMRRIRVLRRIRSSPTPPVAAAADEAMTSSGCQSQHNGAYSNNTGDMRGEFDYNIQNMVLPPQVEELAYDSLDKHRRPVASSPTIRIDQIGPSTSCPPEAPYYNSSTGVPCMDTAWLTALDLFQYALWCYRNQHEALQCITVDEWISKRTLQPTEVPYLRLDQDMSVLQAVSLIIATPGAHSLLLSSETESKTEVEVFAEISLTQIMAFVAIHCKGPFLAPVFDLPVQDYSALSHGHVVTVDANKDTLADVMDAICTCQRQILPVLENGQYVGSFTLTSVNQLITESVNYMYTDSEYSVLGHSISLGMRAGDALELTKRYVRMTKAAELRRKRQAGITVPDMEEDEQEDEDVNGDIAPVYLSTDFPVSLKNILRSMLLGSESHSMVILDPDTRSVLAVIDAYDLWKFLIQGHASSTNESSPLQQVNQSPVGPEEEEFGDGLLDMLQGNGVGLEQ
ncbi:hypothetical protein Pmar_PMAR017618 [Perkinsus marinus ATCC 50983]|uniref:CBS domain-containing protein n=1 Tax=Perkinsus marinus (strain ATCC 50983 / TXsc) TaxID=423536 RepID=C5L3I6_PERM5|nr:hypothetical protein Pmar_PMAR017618 [Perkinsus marinus ATCC 50983]EER08565.1 hypothetical protein Pmar_PMAR017618 [Perkinsus marinus ATCC 50983]|eukprot:XP_002776749.1 hypothetical protein Pmar_PMAR017618 [Perkinsus marinus ATCC 50983]